MTKRAFLAVVLIVGGSVFAEPLILSGRAFTMRVVDAQTGEGVPGVRITTDNGIVCYTLLDGTASFSEFSLMGRDVQFTVQEEGQRFHQLDATLDVRQGAKATLSWPR